MATKSAKVFSIAQFKNKASKSKLTVVAEYKGLSVKKLTALRRELKSSGAEFSIFKNTMARIASEGTESSLLAKDFKGAVGVLFVDSNPIAALKTLVNYSKENNLLSIKSGVFEGQRLDVSALVALSTIPDRPVLLAQIAGMLSSPLVNATRGLHQVIQKLAYGLNEYSKIKQ
jgi:large subunit ribosomal protein L10